MKLRVTMFIILIFMATSTVAFAEFSDVKSDASYYDAISRLSVFGIMNGDNFNKFNPDSMLTREQFAKIIVVTAGLGDDANSLKGSTVFPDIPNNSWASGYINVALSKGFITGMPDGKFHPYDKVTFAQTCTVLVRVLGYTDQDLKGFWPDNYIEKAKVIGLTSGVKLQAMDAMPRWAAAVMINSMLSASIKKTNPQETEKIFSESIDFYKSYIVLANSKTMERLASNQIMTDKGVFYLDVKVKEPELGSKYEFYIKDDKITSVFNKLNKLINYTVESASDTKITYKDKEGRSNSLVLPDKTTYYYNGTKQTYDNLKNLLQTNTSIIFAENSSQDGYEYALIFDPVYSKPEIGSKLDISKKKIGSIAYDDNLPIIRNSQIIKAASIEKYDVCYKISDIWGGNSYILVVDSKVSGKLKGFLPTKVTAKQIQIDTKTYEFGKDMDIGKVRNTSRYNIDDDVIALIGYEGKVVDVIYPYEDSVNYALVLNYSDATAGDSRTIKLLLPNNTTASYKTKDAFSGLKGTLISYNKIDDEYISVSAIEYTSFKDYTINKDDRLIDSYLVTDDVKIYNIMSNNDGSDTQVNILNWSDIPYGNIPAGKIIHINKSGEFGDINIIVASDLLDQKYKLGVVSKISGGRYSIMVDGREYSYNGPVTNAQIGSTTIVSMSGGIDAVLGITYSYNKSTKIQAYDMKRIKINDKVYRFRNDMVIYKKGIDGGITVIGKDDLRTDKTYVDVSLFTDYNNMVKMVLLSEI
ncbi:MAG TPA: S-layer homology domain-containing protein [Pseudobacteroides sp.]|uniref:S-layer homology domain-containing protein n=1 Tax=Pseudobacteroides sp. TaxID=1968840 RepID=UPI002F927F7B